MSSRDERIVKELLAIYMKYSRSEIEHAIAAIKSGGAFHSLAELGMQTAYLSGKHEGPPSTEIIKREARPRSTHRDRLDGYIKTLVNSDSQDNHRLAETLSAARDGQILKTSSALRAISAPMGLLQSRSHDRMSSLLRLGKRMEKLPPDKLRLFIEAAQRSGEPAEPSSLQRWADIIVQKSRD